MNLVISQAGLEDVNEIDQFLFGNRAALPYHHIQWLEAVKLTYGYDYLYLIAKDSGRIVGVMPICIFRGLTGGKSFCSLPFCDVGGVVSESIDVRSALIEFSLSRLESESCNLIEIRQRSVGNESPDNFANRKVGMLLELPDSSEALMQGFKSKLRSQIKKAEKNGLSFDSASDIKSIEEFYDVFSRNMHHLGSPVHSLKWFESLQNQYHQNMLIGKVHYDGILVGVGIIMFSGRNVVIPWASTLRQYNRFGPNMLLYWNLLRIACERGCRIFDFGRSTYQEGTYKFKEQWGARPVLLDWGYLDRMGHSLEMPASSQGKLRGIVESVWKISPLVFANFVGPHLRKHISL